MQALAEPGTILMAEATHRFVEGYVLYERSAVRTRGSAESSRGIPLA